MYVLTMYLSIILERTDVMEIGLRSEQVAGCCTLGIGLMLACFHWFGTNDWVIDWLNSCAIGADRNGAAKRRNHAGIWSGPVAVWWRWSSIQVCGTPVLLWCVQLHHNMSFLSWMIHKIHLSKLRSSSCWVTLQWCPELFRRTVFVS